MTKAQKVRAALEYIVADAEYIPIDEIKRFIEKLSLQGLAIVDVSEPEIPEHLQKDDFLEAWSDFLLMRESLRRKATVRAKKSILNKLEIHTAKKAILILEQSIENGWTTVYPLRASDSFDDIKERWRK